MKFLFLMLLVISTTAHSFTYQHNWTIPNDQTCDNWGTVSIFVPAVTEVLRDGESRKVTIKVPENSISSTISLKTHASQPSVLITEQNLNSPIYIEPRLGANVQKRFLLPVNNLYVYQNHISHEINVGASSIFGASASFKLTEDECNKRNGVVIPHKVIIADLEVKPIILRPDFSFHLNQLEINSKNIYSVNFIFDKNIGNVFYFKTNSIRLVIPDEDYDNDSYTIIQGDCNDDDPKINPNMKNCN